MSMLPLIGVIVDGGELGAWQVDALRTLGGRYRLRFYDCVNMRPQPRALRHYPYYALNIASLRTARTRAVPLDHGSDLVPFECIHEGIWQRLPEQLIARLATDAPIAIVKFGMGLLRVPEQLSIPILSYHHGDPRRFRGRPAGFYELLQGEQVVGQIVQRLSNRLDAGSVVAYGEVKALAHSYRATMDGAYRLSPLLLEPAIRNAAAGRHLGLNPDGKVTRLPGPLTVLRFALARLAAATRRLAYGAFFEKRWQVSTAPAPADPAAMTELPPRAHWSTLPLPEGYSFLADPFFLPDGSILAEALDEGSGLGDIVRITGSGHRKLLGGGHYSYPLPIEIDGKQYLLPEMADQDVARLFQLEGDEARQVQTLRLPGEERLVDPTVVTHEGRTYLFANRLEEGTGVLRLWHGDRLLGTMAEHPCSPVCLSPAGGRMGGPLLLADGKLFRLGQDGSGDYGDGLLMFEIEQLTPTDYRERRVHRLSCAGEDKGPHTLDVQGGRLLFDHYRERFSLLAGVRRLKFRLARR